MLLLSMARDTILGAVTNPALLGAADSKGAVT